MLGLGVAGLLSNCAEKERKVHVFQLVSAPAPSPVVAPSTPPRSTPVQRSSTKPPRKKTTPPRKKTTPPRKRTTPPRKKTTPPPKKTTPPPKKTAPPPDQVVSFDVFRKAYPAPKRPTPSPQPVVKTPQFDPNDFQVTVRIPKIQVVGNVSPPDPAAFSNYLGRVKSLIEKEWRRLQADANLRSPGNLFVETKVEFRIGSNGALRFPRLAQTSSYGEFDRLVLRAVRNVATVPPPPLPINSPLSMTFRFN